MEMLGASNDKVTSSIPIQGTLSLQTDMQM